MDLFDLYRSTLWPKRLENFIGTFCAMLALVFCRVFCPSVMAKEQNGWQVDSLQANSSVSKSDAQQVYEILLKMLDRWNAHDIEGHLDVYWKSPELLVVIDSEQFNGWRNFTIPTSMAIGTVMRWDSSDPHASKSSC
jgi:hypothetical protein